jgi:hypothetical protein
MMRYKYVEELGIRLYVCPGHTSADRRKYSFLLFVVIPSYGTGTTTALGWSGGNNSEKRKAKSDPSYGRYGGRLAINIIYYAPSTLDFSVTGREMKPGPLGNIQAMLFLKTIILYFIIYYIIAFLLPLCVLLGREASRVKKQPRSLDRF